MFLGERVKCRMLLSVEQMHAHVSNNQISPSPSTFPPGLNATFLKILLKQCLSFKVRKGPIKGLYTVFLCTCDRDKVSMLTVCIRIFSCGVFQFLFATVAGSRLRFFFGEKSKKYTPVNDCFMLLLCI